MLSQDVCHLADGAGLPIGKIEYLVLGIIILLDIHDTRYKVINLSDVKAVRAIPLN